MENFYVPILKWKQGEYLSLSRLDDKVKDHVLPLIEIPKIGYDFENLKDSKTIDEHLENFPKRYKAHWGKRAAFIDTNIVDGEVLKNGQLPIEFLFESLGEENHNLIPVTGINRSEQQIELVRNIFRKRKDQGICVRLALDEIFDDGLTPLLSRIGATPSDAHLILDLAASNFNDIQNFSKMIVTVLTGFPNISDWRSVTICGTSFPENLTSVKKPGKTIPRNEWNLFLEIIKIYPKTLPLPNFGDYAISHPDQVEGDMRMLSPAATIRYTMDNSWYIAKGGKVRPNNDEKKIASEGGKKFEGFAQFRDLCKQIVDQRASFSGTKFSKADEYILGCSEGKVSTGNLSTWRWVGNNHHITKVVGDLDAMNFFP